MPTKEAELPLFTKTYDFLTWLVPLTNHFPKLHRHTITQRLIEAALDFQEHLLQANGVRNAARLIHLDAADADLSKVRIYLRMAHRWSWISEGQYEHASRLLAELGRLLGAWQKNTRQQPANQAAPVGTG